MPDVPAFFPPRTRLPLRSDESADDRRVFETIEKFSREFPKSFQILRIFLRLLSRTAMHREGRGVNGSEKLLVSRVLPSGSFARERVSRWFFGFRGCVGISKRNNEAVFEARY